MPKGEGKGMEKKPVYCDCEKTPGGVLELEGDLAGMIHAKCGGKIVMPSVIIGWIGEEGGKP